MRLVTRSSVRRERMDRRVVGNEWYKTVVDYEIRPLLREYWFDDRDADKAK